MRKITKGIIDIRPPGSMKACVALVHGLGEHTGRYVRLAESLADAGYGVYGCDLPGHGHTPGRRGHVASYKLLCEHVARTIAGAAEAGVPVILLGQSMGGALVLNYILRNEKTWPSPHAVISLSPGLRTTKPVPSFKISLARLLVKISPWLTMHSGINPDDFSHDPSVAEIVRHDPLYHFRISARMGLDIIEAGNWAMKNVRPFEIPLLLMHGGGDRTTSVDASRDFASKAGPMCTYKEWEGMYHELHNETSSDEIVSYMIDWMDEQVIG